MEIMEIDVKDEDQSLNVSPNTITDKDFEPVISKSKRK
jgi:hypothetical protein